MHELDEVIQFIIDALSANAAKGQGSVLTIRIAPYAKGKETAPSKQAYISSDDVLDAHEILKTFDGDFKKVFGARKGQNDA